MSSSSERPSVSLWVLDRIEEGLAVMICDDGRQLTCPSVAGAAEGDVFEQRAGELIPLPEETAARKERINAKAQRIFHKRK